MSGEERHAQAAQGGRRPHDQAPDTRYNITIVYTCYIYIYIEREISLSLSLSLYICIYIYIYMLHTMYIIHTIYV